MYKRTKPISDMDAYVEERLSDYLDGTLSAKERAKVEAHLQQSARARASLESLRYTVELLKETPPPPLPRQFTLPVSTRAPAASRGWLVWGLRGVAVAATLAFVLLLGLNLVRQSNTSQNASEPLAANVPPTALIAQGYSLPATPIATFPSQLQDSSAGGAAATAPAPQILMQTTTPETFAPAVVPVTQTPLPATSQPTQNKSLPRSNTSAPAPTSVPATTQAPAPTQEPSVIAAAANSALSGTPQEPPAAATASAATERSTLETITVEGVVTASQLLVREGPGLEYGLIGGLKKGEQVNVLGRSQDSKWLYLDLTRNHKTGNGWVGAMFVELSGELDALPFYDETGVPLPPLIPTDTPMPSETPSVTRSSTEPNETPDVSQSTPPLITATSEAENNGSPTLASPATTDTPVIQPSDTPTVQSEAHPTSPAKPAGAPTKTPKPRPTKQPTQDAMPSQ